MKQRKKEEQQQPRKRMRPCAVAFTGSIVLPLVQSQLRSDSSSKHNSI